MARSRISIAVLLTTLIGSEAALASETGASPEGPTVALATNSNYADFMMLMVDKSALAAELRTWPEKFAESKLLKSFKIAIGKAEGDKEFEGDNKTPEGVYFAQHHIDGNTLPEKYGTMAIPIDFPNPIDQMKGKTGHGIWLHGVDRESRIEEAKVTEGCVAFYNSDIANLASWLKSHQGVVVIAGDLKTVNQQDDLEAVRSSTLSWMDSWANRDIDGYISWYAPAFNNAGMNLKAYKDYKQRVFSSYKTMTVAYDHLRVITHPKYAISFFNQDFRGDNRFVSDGRKVLYWEKTDEGHWRIVREIFEKRRFEFVTFTESELALLGDKAQSGPAEKEKKSPNL
jgi:murein L,D-transpeptidase YafK